MSPRAMTAQAIRIEELRWKCESADCVHIDVTEGCAEWCGWCSSECGGMPTRLGGTKEGVGASIGLEVYEKAGVGTDCIA